MKWNGRTYRPANAQYITKKKPFDFQEALKPYGEKELPVWNAIVSVNNETSTPVPVTPTPTPSNTPTGTPASTTTPTPTNTNTPTNTGTPTNTPTNTGTPTRTPNPTTTPTNTPTQTNTPTTTLTLTPTNTPTLTRTPTPSPVVYDSGATAYLNALIVGGATGITESISAATNTFFTTIRSAGIISKLYRMYPYVGGVSTSMGINALLPGTDNITFTGGWTFSSSGATPNGVNAYSQTAQQGAQSAVFALGAYLNDGFTTNTTAVGAYDGNVDLSYISFGAGVFQGASNTTIGTVKTTTAQTRGFYGITRISNTQEVFIQNTSATTVNSTYAACNRAIAIGARNSDGTINDWFSKRIAFVFFGTSFSSSDMITFYNAIQTYQTALGRQV